MTIGSSQPNKLWHSLIISILDVLKSFIKNLFNMKSSEFIDLLTKLHTFRQYKRTGKHFCLCSEGKCLGMQTRPFLSRPRLDRDNQNQVSRPSRGRGVETETSSLEMSVPTLLPVAPTVLDGVFVPVSCRPGQRRWSSPGQHVVWQRRVQPTHTSCTQSQRDRHRQVWTCHDSTHQRCAYSVFLCRLFAARRNA